MPINFISKNSFWASLHCPFYVNPTIMAFHETTFRWGISLKNFRASLMSRFCAYPAIMVVCETTFCWCILLNSSHSFHTLPHFLYMSLREFATITSYKNPFLIISSWISTPSSRAGMLLQDGRMLEKETVCRNCQCHWGCLGPWWVDTNEGFVYSASCGWLCTMA